MRNPDDLAAASKSLGCVSVPLRVWWIPQIPGKPFYVRVESPAEAQRVMSILAAYDAFQFENKIKPDYCNAGGLEAFSQDGDCEWCDWYDPETGDGIDSITGDWHEHEREMKAQLLDALRELQLAAAGVLEVSGGTPHHVALWNARLAAVAVIAKATSAIANIEQGEVS